MNAQLSCHTTNGPLAKLVLPSDVLKQLHLSPPVHASSSIPGVIPEWIFGQHPGWGQIKLPKGAKSEYRNHEFVRRKFGGYAMHDVLDYRRVRDKEGLIPRSRAGRGSSRFGPSAPKLESQAIWNAVSVRGANADRTEY